MKYLVVIPARGGSKGVPRKNIKLLNGKSLISYTIEAAKAVFDEGEILVTTDDVEIKKEAERCGLMVPFLRPEHLSTDGAGSYEVICHALEYCESNMFQPDAIVLLQPTSPFRNAQHITEALTLYSGKEDMVVSVNVSKQNPYFNLFEEDENGFLQKSKSSNFTSRQQCPKVWEYNGAIYIINPKSLKNQRLNEFSCVKPYPMSELDSVDIDTELDWLIAEHLLKAK